MARDDTDLMPDPCPRCGKDRKLVGRAHNCTPQARSSAVEHRTLTPRVARSNRAASAKPQIEREKLTSKPKTKRKKPGPKPGAGGRPRIDDPAKMSARTRYRREAEKNHAK